jgi:hypothetical protein
VKQIIIDKLKMLDESTNQLLNDLSQLTSDSLSKNPPNSWSLLQVLSHLNTAEASSLKYMKKKVQAGDKMGKIKAWNEAQMKLTNWALASSLKWKAPSYVANPPVVKSLEEMKTIWMQTRTEIMSFVTDYPDEYIDRLVYKHPMGGRQNLNNAIDSFVYHQRHHVHQIKRIKKSLGI